MLPIETFVVPHIGGHPPHIVSSLHEATHKKKESDNHKISICAVLYVWEVGYRGFWVVVQMLIVWHSGCCDLGLLAQEGRRVVLHLHEYDINALRPKLWHVMLYKVDYISEVE